VAAAGFHLAAVLLGTPGTSGLNLSQVAALLLTLMIIAALAWLRRNAGRLQALPPGAAPAGQPGRLLLAAFTGAVLVAGITTPGLAASTAGQFAVPHGEHGSAPATGGHHRR
jgi:membrane protease YdiL (CAAX protease family)